MDYNKLVPWIKECNDKFHGLEQNFEKEKYLNKGLKLCQKQGNFIEIVNKEYDYVFTMPGWKGERISGKSGKTKFKTPKTGVPYIENIILKNGHSDGSVLARDFDHLMIMQTSGTFKIGFVHADKVLEKDSNGEYKYIHEVKGHYEFSYQHIKQGIFKRFPVSEVDVVYEKNLNDVQIVKEIVSSDDIITCLLYTSPSPRDRTRSRMPSSA